MYTVQLLELTTIIFRKFQIISATILKKLSWPTIVPVTLKRSLFIKKDLWRYDIPSSVEREVVFEDRTPAHAGRSYLVLHSWSIANKIYFQLKFISLRSCGFWSWPPDDSCCGNSQMCTVWGKPRVQSDLKGEFHTWLGCWSFGRVTLKAVGSVPLPICNLLRSVIKLCSLVVAWWISYDRWISLLTKLHNFIKA